MLPELTTCALRSVGRPRGRPPIADGVYVPQEDSQLLVGVMASMGLAHRKRVLDLCTGSGVVAIAAAELGAAGVTAVDICPRAVRCAQANALAAGVEVDVRQGPWMYGLTAAPFEVVVVNPPYVPTPPGAAPPTVAGSPPRSWDGGVDGRAVLGPLCESAGALLCPGGALLMVQSEFADVDRSLLDLWAAGLSAEVVAEQRIPFGPVLSSRLDWMQQSGRMVPGCRSERLVVIRADKP